MAKFKITAINKQGQLRELTYDNLSSELVWSDTLQPVTAAEGRTWPWVSPISKDEPGTKKGIRTVKISLGLACNYSCSYCSQRFVPRVHAHPNDAADIEEFVRRLPEWFDVKGTDGKGSGQSIEFWGGEPLVYWKTLQPLATAIRELMPHARFSIVTNGALLTPMIIDFLCATGFTVGISHDGPGQQQRGPDPLADPDRAAQIKNLYKRLHPYGRVSINPMLTRKNRDRGAIQKFLQEHFGEDVHIAEGGFVDPYDRGGLAAMLLDSEHLPFRAQAFRDMRSGSASNFETLATRLQEFIGSIYERRPAMSVGQKCRMDMPDVVAVTLAGEVLTCQNVSSVSTAPNGESHCIGSVYDMDKVVMRTATSWQNRQECRDCPLVQLCKGSCMFLEGDLFKAACNNSYTDNLPIFAAAVDVLTGYVPISVTGPHPLSRHAIWANHGRV